eukprot:g36635.t1
MSTSPFLPLLQVTQYLTTEFYAVNYSLSQRLDILDVLALAAQELSQPDSSQTATSESPSIQLLRSEASGPHNPSQQWKKIIEKRIENKTRRFTRGASRPEPKAVPNRLSSVAGHFFFPLIRNYDRYVRQGTLFAVSSVLLSVPSHILLTEVPDELLEIRSWLAEFSVLNLDFSCCQVMRQ